MISPDGPVAADILRRAMVARIATVSRTGRPHVNPLYFVYGKGRIYLGTVDRTLAALNIKANPRVTILFNVEREPNDARVLRIHGDATVRTDTKLYRWYVVHDVWKYFVSRRGFANTLAHARLLPLVRRFVTSGEKGVECVIEVRPDVAELLAAANRLNPS
ncbi:MULTISPECIES: pyridoxamine 5'-phosphate oxidase family protein [unclassified Mycolicibacterium]|uniref:pyridoxamine 5'-phosphate oxidase family protein n=1 Tax=unclassified Mycolicibacterium TaxID=2636767 RepID=UPI0012DEA0F7|nr:MULTISPECIES: pyridoxamine 5'-phosphate oxidase family protein [unclassified Mycolicibacterium]MUL81325.1 pyridoxamine 5'-phosphate oxidase family protein [Mycolicibacterium sp. CBMA 329]MUL87091.1 pyridoxamine 5'-phosphate oxidase family protein [Mycolicibacterium sp. CBMA 331]MUL98627.1 pyridoxamine 5'-phosphate oxidase family protein [Mycolicibacterium sp. CBMA 334]MUM29503.1 pyridoxamine 5'-phosphate oxidase family protein [Mycolicibacterium sp. CBMA 295]MUM37388.1 pyridoxamine 5'-phosp